MSRLQRLRDQYDAVIAIPGHSKTKRLLLQEPTSSYPCFELVQRRANHYLIINSQDNSQSIHPRESVYQLQQRILDKQSIKIALSEEIDNLEDDYFELQKVIHSKRRFCEKLQGKIVLASMPLTRKVKPEEMQQKEGLSARLINFFLF